MTDRHWDRIIANAALVSLNYTCIALWLLLVYSFSALYFTLHLLCLL